MKEQAKGYSFTLLHKALLLVIIPFCFNSIWLILLWNDLNKAQRLAKMERQQSRFTECLNAVLKDSYQTRENFIGFIATSRKNYLSNADFLIERTKQALKQLRSLPDLTDDQHLLASELEEIIVDQSQLIGNVLKHSAQDSKLGLLEDVEPVSDRVDSVLNKYPNTEAHMARQRMDLENARADAQRSDERAQMTLVWGISGNFIITVILVLAIRRELAKRLKTLMDNTKRLPKQQTLHAPISGFDELSDLDRSLHEASTELAKAQEFRKAIMQMVAHDLRSPLSTCLVAIEVMADQPGADMKHIGAIRSSLTRVINLANDLLMIEQMESMHLPLKSEVENMQELVDHACSTLCALSSAADVRLVNELGPEYVIVDRKRILQVLVNYLSNAIKFSPAQSSISISSLKSEGMLKVLVRDNGPGIPQEEQAKLFERFYQTKAGRAAGGTGLGLTSAKMIVEAHNGTVGVMSEQGKGALFWFTVPLPNE